MTLNRQHYVLHVIASLCIYKFTSKILEVDKQLNFSTSKMKNCIIPVLEAVEVDCRFLKKKSLENYGVAYLVYVYSFSFNFVSKVHICNSLAVSEVLEMVSLFENKSYTQYVSQNIFSGIKSVIKAL